MALYYHTSTSLSRGISNSNRELLSKRGNLIVKLQTVMQYELQASTAMDWIKEV